MDTDLEQAIEYLDCLADGNLDDASWPDIRSLVKKYSDVKQWILHIGMAFDDGTWKMFSTISKGVTDKEALKEAINKYSKRFFEDVGATKTPQHYWLISSRVNNNNRL